MNRGNHRFRPSGMLLTTLMVLAMSLGVYACGGSSGSSTTPTAPAEPAATNFTEVFIDGVRSLTPNVATSAVNDWDGWCADGAESHQYSVLNKLFNPDSGWESVYGPVDQAEVMLEILESHAEQLEEEGTVELEPGDGLTYTATMTDVTGDVQVPYFNVAQSGLTKRVVITSDDNSMRMMVAYDMEGDEKAMVAHQIRAMGEETEYMVFRANYNEATEDLQIWAAAVADKADSFKIQFVWKGNMADGTFAISQYTNAAKEDLGGGVWGDGFWKVMGGGTLEGEMAFRANTRDSEADDYFIVATLAEIVDSSAPDGFPADAGTIDSATYAVQGYVDQASALCLGYLDGFPEVDDLDDWAY